MTKQDVYIVYIYICLVGMYMVSCEGELSIILLARDRCALIRAI